MIIRKNADNTFSILTEGNCLTFDVPTLKIDRVFTKSLYINNVDVDIDNLNVQKIVLTGECRVIIGKNVSRNQPAIEVVDKSIRSSLAIDGLVVNLNQHDKHRRSVSRTSSSKPFIVIGKMRRSESLYY